jgi:hypothetical protein
MVRFTDEQLRFGQAMKMMIDVYHRLKAIDSSLIKLGDKPGSWFSKSIIMDLAEVFALTIPNFYPCMYFAEYSKFRYRGEDEEITITNGGILNFIEAMESLKDDVSGGITKCFNIREIIVQYHERPDSGSSDSSEIDSHNEGKKGCAIVPVLDRTKARKVKISDYHHRLHTRLNDDPAKFDSFILGTHDYESALEIFAAENYDIDNPERSWKKVYSPGFSNKTVSLTDVLIYILIRYQYLFGSFKRVKVCKQCGNLFFEKRLGAREFCSGLCRKHYNDNLQPPESRHCRDRQNQWMDNKSRKIFSVSSIYRVQRDDCAECDGTKKSGECPALIKKNKKAFAELAKIGN